MAEAMRDEIDRLKTVNADEEKEIELTVAEMLKLENLALKQRIIDDDYQKTKGGLKAQQDTVISEIKQRAGVSIDWVVRMDPSELPRVKLSPVKEDG
jgi:hypothetical protein